LGNRFFSFDRFQSDSGFGGRLVPFAHTDHCIPYLLVKIWQVTMLLNPLSSFWGPAQRSFRDECQLQVVNDPVGHGVVGEESDDAHLATALRADHGVDFAEFAAQLSLRGAKRRGNLIIFLRHNEIPMARRAS
jgi:hypothetical protein